MNGVDLPVWSLRDRMDAYECGWNHIIRNHLSEVIPYLCHRDCRARRRNKVRDQPFLPNGDHRRRFVQRFQDYTSVAAWRLGYT